MKEREKNPLFHHKSANSDTQKKVFDQLTIASTVLSDPPNCFQEIDRVLHAALALQAAGLYRAAARLVFCPAFLSTAPRIHERSDPKSLRAALKRSRGDDQ